MTIPTLRTIRTTVYDNFGVRLKFIQPSRHRLEGVLKFSARLGNWLTDAGNKRSNFQNFQIPNLSVIGVRLMSKHPLGTRGPGVRLSAVAPLTEKSRFALWPSPLMDCSEIRQVDASVEGAHLFFYVRLLSDRWFGQDLKKCKFLQTPSGRR